MNPLGHNLGPFLNFYPGMINIADVPNVAQPIQSNSQIFDETSITQDSINRELLPLTSSASTYLGFLEDHQPKRRGRISPEDRMIINRISSALSVYCPEDVFPTQWNNMMEDVARKWVLVNKITPADWSLLSVTTEFDTLAAKLQERYQEFRQLGYSHKNLRSAFVRFSASESVKQITPHQKIEVRKDLLLGTPSNVIFDMEYVDCSAVTFPEARIPRPYQEEAYQRILAHINKNHDRGLIVLPTGTGKTALIMMSLATLFNNSKHRDKRALVVSHRSEIIKQNYEEARLFFGEDHTGYWQGEHYHNFDAKVVSASIGTLISNQNYIDWDSFDILILDEAHHYVPSNTWFQVVERMGFAEQYQVIHNQDKILLGFTATTDRLTGDSLSTVYQKDLLYTRGLHYFITNAHLLSPKGITYEMTGIDESGKTLNPDKTWKRLPPPSKAEIIAEVLSNPDIHPQIHVAKTVVFLESVDEVKEIETILLTEYGINAVGVYHNQSDQTERLDNFKSGRKNVLLNVDIATEGFDDPGIEIVVMGRSTESRSLVVQQVGRALRPDPKRPHQKEAIIVDLVGNLEKHSLSISTELAFEWDPKQEISALIKDREKNHPVEKDRLHIAEIRYQSKNLTLNLGDNIFAQQLASCFIDEDMIHSISFEVGLNSDTVFNWINGNRLPGRMDEFLTLAKRLGRSAELNLAYLETVNGVKKRFLIEELNQMALELGRIPTSKDCGGKWPSEHAFVKIFDSWNNALNAANLSINVRTTPYTPHELTNILDEMKRKLRRTPKAKDCGGKWPSQHTFVKVFGSWNNALNAANLSINVRTTPYTRHELLDILHEMKTELGRTPKTKDCGGKWPSHQVFSNEFGSWNNTLKATNLSINVRTTPYTRHELIDILHEMKTELGRTPKTKDCGGKWPSHRVFSNEFGPWNNTLKAADLSINVRKRPHSEEELIRTLIEMGDELGRTPKLKDCGGKWPSQRAFSNVFGSWNNALNSAGFELNLRLTHFPKDELIGILQQMATELGRTPKTKDCGGKWPSYRVFSNEFGSWNKALKSAGLKA